MAHEKNKIPLEIWNVINKKGRNLCKKYLIIIGTYHENINITVKCKNYIILPIIEGNWREPNRLSLGNRLVIEFNLVYWSIKYIIRRIY